jgi:hypothetical protein
LNKPTSIAPLVAFRAIFGFMMLGGIIRFWQNGWIEEQYIKPLLFFPFYSFEWIKPLSETSTYWLFGIMAISALFIGLGLLYRLASIVFFISFSYVEFIDKSNYLNHYYFIILVAFVLIFLPANKKFSLDSILFPSIKADYVPTYTIFIIQLQLGIVYFYAGLAKLNYEWLIEAKPLRIWLPSKANLAVVGFLLDKLWVAYLFSWFGAIYDLTVPFLLSFKKTRLWAYLAVIVFHVATSTLFQIGMFPYIMILSTLIFFPSTLHEKIISIISKPSFSSSVFKPSVNYNRLMACIFIPYIIFQLSFPFRFVLYPGKLFWTEQGYRFSWRVMLMEKAGTAFFYVKDEKTGKEIEVTNSDFLTPNQEKMMSFQPDMILQFAHKLAEIYEARGFQNPKVRVESYVSLNGEGSRMFIDPNCILNEQQESWKHKEWILPY